MLKWLKSFMVDFSIFFEQKRYVYSSHHKIQKWRRYVMSSFWHWSFLHSYNNYTLLQICTRPSEHVHNQTQNLLGFLRPKPHRPHTIWQQRKERIFISLFSWSYVVVTRELKIIVRSKESLNHSFLFDLNWCQIKRKREKRKRGWLYWPKSLKDKFFSCFHLYPYIILYVSMLLLGLFLFFFLYSSIWWQRSRWWSCWRWWI